MNIKVKKLNGKARLPYYASNGAAGADLFACLSGEVMLESGERYLIPTGLAVEIPSGYGGFVFPRSSLSSKFGVTLSNCVGVIDSDYRGEVKIPVVNLGSAAYTIKDGDRIAQLAVMLVEIAVFTEVRTLGETERGAGGFGSTGAD